MKKIVFLAAALMAMAACNKEMPQEVIPGEKEVALTVTATGNRLSTKAEAALQTADESKVSDLQVFVFRNGKQELDAYGHAENALQVTITCTAGAKDVIALVNAPDYKAVATRDELLAKVSELSANTRNHFEMIGEAKNQSILSSDNQISVSVDRLVSRVVLGKITKNFSSAALQALDLTVKSVYLINAAGNATYSDKFEVPQTKPLKWYNKTKVVADDMSSANVKSLLFKEFGQKVEGSPLETNLSLYAYPNLNACNEDGTDTDDQPNDTRLVIETTLDDGPGGNEPRTYYYSINMPQMDSNKSYEISNLTLTRPGSDDPNKPTVFHEGTFSITVTDWSVELLNSDGNITL